ncbi:MAG: iron ABC transporter permease [Desulfobacterales bacterium]|nr:iron ABC transporter permease [Desulfobacterales bacterium]
MTAASTPLIKRLLLAAASLSVVLAAVLVLALSIGSGSEGILRSLSVVLGQGEPDSALETIVWRIRLPRALLAALAGGTLSLGGLVFQALLRNPLAEPYILGVSGGSAIGAIIGILLGLSRFPGVSVCAFLGSLATLVLIVAMSSGPSVLKKDALLLSGVMVNAFCAAVIMFLVSMTQDARLHNIIFWLMGDLSSADGRTVVVVAAILAPCFGIIFLFSHAMNLLLMGNEMARSMGLHLRSVTVALLVVTSLMVSAIVSYSGLIGFVGLVIPHLLRFVWGPDHRVLVPACILGGGAYLTACDILARSLSDQGEMPAGVITALIGAPLFIFLLKKTRR